MIISLFKKLFPPAAPQLKGLVLGHRMAGGSPILLDDSTLRSHVMLSGRGAVGEGLLLKQMLTQQTVEGRGWIHIDPACDEELLNHLANVASEAGRSNEFYVLDLADPSNSNTYDVLRAGTAETRAGRILSLLPFAQCQGGEQYAEILGSFLTTMLEAIDATGRSVGMRELSELLLRLDEPGVRSQLLADIPEGHPAGVALSLALADMESQGIRQRWVKDVCAGMVGDIHRMAALECSPVLNHPRPEIDFEEMLTHGKMCYVRLSRMGKDRIMHAIASMVLQDIASAMPARASLPREQRKPFLVAMDSFPLYGMSDIHGPLSAGTYAQARALGVCLIPVVDTADWDWFHRLPGTPALTQNTGTKVYFQQNASVHLAQQHPAMPATALTSQQPGEFVLSQGSSLVKGQVRYTKLGTPPNFNMRVLPAVDSRPRWLAPKKQTTT